MYRRLGEHATADAFFASGLHTALSRAGADAPFHTNEVLVLKLVNEILAAAARKPLHTNSSNSISPGNSTEEVLTGSGRNSVVEEMPTASLAQASNGETFAAADGPGGFQIPPTHRKLLAELPTPPPRRREVEAAAKKDSHGKNSAAKDGVDVLVPTVDATLLATYFRQNRPCLISAGLLANWPALKRWSKQGLQRSYSDVRVGVGRSISPHRPSGNPDHAAEEGRLITGGGPSETDRLTPDEIGAPPSPSSKDGPLSEMSLGNFIDEVNPFFRLS